MSLYRKHRPQNFSDLVGQDPIRDTLLQAVKQGKISHAYLFCGPRGTGKTTAARILAKAANCLDLKGGEPCNKCEDCKEILSGRSIDVIEIDAASNRGIDEIRELRENVKFSPSKLRQKVYIIDEVHMLTREAFNALLKTLEEPPAHAMFILATTEAHKVPATIISRTQRFDFRRIKKDDIIKNLKNIAKIEEIKIDDRALDLVATNAEGGHRDAISLLDQISSLTKDISAELAESVLGIAKKEEIFALIWAIFNSSAEEGLKIAHRVFEQGGSMTEFNAQVIDILRKILLYVASGNEMFEDTAENIIKIKELGDVFKAKFGGETSLKVVELIDEFMDSSRLLKDVSYPVIPLEIAVVEGIALLGGQSTDKDTAGNTEKKAESAEKISNSKFPIPDENLSPNVNKADSHQYDSKKSLTAESYKLEADVSVPVAEIPRPVAEIAVFEQMSEDTWKNIVTNIKQTNTTLAALLRDAKPLGREEDFIILGVKFAFHKDKISELAHLKIIETEIKKVTGKDYKIKCQIADLKKRPTKPASEEELQAAAEEIFNS